MIQGHHNGTEILLVTILQWVVPWVIPGCDWIVPVLTSSIYQTNEYFSIFETNSVRNFFEWIAMIQCSYDAILVSTQCRGSKFSYFGNSATLGHTSKEHQLNPYLINLDWQQYVHYRYESNTVCQISFIAWIYSCLNQGFFKNPCLNARSYFNWMAIVTHRNSPPLLCFDS